MTAGSRKRAYRKGRLLAEQAGALVRIALLEAATLAIGVRRAEDRGIALAGPLLRIAEGRIALPGSVRVALVLDLTGVGFAGSLGLSELIMLDHEAATYGQEVRVVVGRNYPLQRAVASAGLEGSFPIFGSMDDALA